MKKWIIGIAAVAFVGTLFAASGVFSNSPAKDSAKFRNRNTTLRVTIDIKPYSNPNPINLKSPGVIAVAILTTDSFDATSVVPESVRFAGAAPLRWTIEDVGVSPELPDGSPMPPDGDNDLLLHFDKMDLNVTKGETVAKVSGYYRTDSGALKAFYGEDTIKVLHSR